MYNYKDMGCKLYVFLGSSSIVNLFVISVLAITTSGCWAPITNRDNGEDLLADPQIFADSVPVSIEKFWRSEVQRFDYESEVVADNLVRSWSELPGQTDVTFDLVEALRDIGFKKVSLTGNPDSKYRITGFVDAREELAGWKLAYMAIMIAPSIFLPVPLFSNWEGRIVISIYNQQGYRIALKTTYIKSDNGGLWFYGAVSSEKTIKSNCVKAAAKITALMLTELEENASA